MTDLQDMDMQEIDEELLEIFVEESNEIIESIEVTMKSWVEAPTDANLLAEFKRPLHTLKGGARLAGLDEIGNLTHLVESLLIEIENNTVDGTAVVGICQDGMDELAHMLEIAASQKMPVLSDALAASFNLHLGDEVVTETLQAEPELEDEDDYDDDEINVQQTLKSQSLTEGTGLEIVRSVLLPLVRRRLLLPNAAVAEIIPYMESTVIDDTPEWCVGSIVWRGETIPVVSFESLAGDALPKISKRSRIAVCNGVSGMSGAKFFGLICAQIPHLIKVHENNVKEAEEQSGLPTSLQEVLIEEVSATIPRVDFIEDQLRKEVPMSAY
ncbi:MAG: hypothetical protein HOM11_15640 [Methylococcales bacterium]|jgi:chemotaxis signal transduction protein/HPt (histidine-containing phosphotransfer) domain-containing protein|nr:hypothetical protein [Methylococcales bacterium]MBT7444619.1 hypothetical protein [Methylococcales bacterium]